MGYLVAYAHSIHIPCECLWGAQIDHYIDWARELYKELILRAVSYTLRAPNIHLLKYLLL